MELPQQARSQMEFGNEEKSAWLALHWNPFSAKLDSVKTTIDIPEKELKEAMRHSRSKTKREAVLIALAEYNRLQRVEKIIAKFGTMDGIMTQAELAKMREMD